ncbi:MAG: PAS domain S-box protein [Spirulinaceae cyanobacterium]
MPENSSDSVEPTTPWQHGHQKLTFYLENSPLACIEWDADFRVRHWSKRAEEILGWSATEVENKHWLDFKFVGSEDLEKVIVVTQELQSGRVTRNVCCNRNYTKAGVILYCEWYNSALFDEEGRLVSILSLVQDVSDREQNAALLQKAQRLAHLGSWEYDMIHHTCTGSEELFRILGYDSDQPIPPIDGYHHFFDENDWQKLKNASAEAIATRQIQALELRIICQDGVLRYVDVTIEAILNLQGECIKTMGTMQDVSDRAIAQQSLKASERRFRTMFEQVGVGMAELDLSGQFIQVNQRLCDFLGYSKAELLNLSFQDITHPDDMHIDADCSQRFMRGELNDVIYEKRYIHKNGSIRWVKVTVSTIYNEANQPQSVLGVIEDIHDHKLAQEALRLSEERFQEIAATLEQFFFVRCCQTGQYLYLSPAYEKIWQRSRTSLYADPTSWIELVHPEDQDLVFSSIAEQQKGKSAYREYRIIRDNGEIRWIRAHVQVICAENGKPLRTIGIAEDITTLALQRQELARSNAELEQFAYVASHDLQAPLAVISGYAQLLQSQYQNQLGDRADTMLNGLVRSTQRMQSPIEDLLKYSSLDRETQPFQPWDCEQIVEDAIANLEVLISTHNATITYHNLPTIHGSRSQLLQLFQNLIANAIKYQARDRLPTIAITIEKQGPLYHFAVQDNGIGIAPQHQDRIFQLFERLQTAQDSSGSGIGLALCKKIIERHGGRIWVESVVNQGSTFYFTLS